MTTSPQIAEDEILPSETTIYRNAVEQILRDHPSPDVAEYLSQIPFKNGCVVDHASHDMANLLLASVRFGGRYQLGELLHRGDGTVILAAKDYSLQEEYTRLKGRMREREEGMADDGKLVTWAILCNFGKRLGLGERHVKIVLKRIVRSGGTVGGGDEFDDESTLGGSGSLASKTHKSLRSIVEREEEFHDDDDGTKSIELGDVYNETKEESVDISSRAFTEFGRLYGVQDGGVRHVVFKFILRKHHFLREKAARKRLDLEVSDWPVVPILEDYDVDQGRSKDLLFARDLTEKKEAVPFDLGGYKYGIVLPKGERDLKGVWGEERPGILKVREFLSGVGNDIRRLHAQSIIHGNLRLDNIVRLPSSNISLISLSSCYILNNSSNPEYVCGDTHKLSSGYLPPELICKINTTTQKNLLERYEMYWKSVSNDAKDLKLLTPDDIQIISTVLKTLLAREETKKAAEAGNTGSPSPSTSAVLSNLNPAFTNHQEWKELLSLALITISFDDLPHSLTGCKSIQEFAQVWKRLLSNAHLWEKIKPRFTEDQSTAYLIKSFQETAETNDNPSLLPYSRVRASPKLDIWSFGMLTFSLCSHSYPFHVNAESDLIHTSSFERLFKWDKKMAEQLIHNQIDDPLAQDLLLQILLPVDERLGTMDEVLTHPFFGPASTLEAQWILEKHEEQQLMMEETAVIPKMTTETTTRLENTTEKQCKIVFEEEKIVVPTCLIILPYQLTVSADGRLTVPHNHIDTAIRVGKHLLDINKATARLSFWLMMKKNMAGNNGPLFKSRLKDWLKRARTEPGELVAKEIVKAIGCGEEYIPLCREMLEKGDVVSQAKSYIKDPMGAARVAIRQSTELLVKCFAMDMQFLYLVDEYNGVPVLGENERNARQGAGAEDDDDVVYPIPIDPNTRHLQNLFLPFVNISVMTVTAVNGLTSLKRLLGLPASHPIPDSWRDTKPGLVHKLDQPTSVAEFAVLQDVVRKQDQQAMATNNSSRSMNNAANPSSRNVQHNAARRLSGKYDSVRSDVSAWSESTFVEGSEMRQLEVFFREYDPMRMFSGLRRVSDGSNGGSNSTSAAIWTTEDVVRKIQGEVELAGVETKLRELKKELAMQDKIKQEINMLSKQVRVLKRIDHPGGGGGTDDQAMEAPRARPPPDIGRAPPPKARQNDVSNNNPGHKYTQDYTNPNSTFNGRNNGNNNNVETEDEKRMKMRRAQSSKKKKRFRPYFSTC